MLEKLLERDISTKSIFDIFRSRNNLSEIYQPNLFLIYLAREITWARYINWIHFWYISCLNNYLSKINQPNPFLIYILLEKLLERDISTKSIFVKYQAWEIIRARYIYQIHFWFISLEKWLEQNISTKSISYIFCSRNYLSEIYQPNLFLIYLALEITWARYINQIYFQYISLKKFLEQDL